MAGGPPAQLATPIEYATGYALATPRSSFAATEERMLGKLPSSLISVEYMHLYSMHDFNRLMSAMSIDGIWQNNLIYFEIRRNAASLFGIRIRIQGG